MCTMYYMLLIKDSMVLIHLAKIALLEESCEYFKDVIIPPLVFKEVTRSKDKHPDAQLIEEFVKKGEINVREIKKKEYIRKARALNIQKGEAEAVALYWQEKANALATDDDNVRKKKELLRIKLIGTPSIIITLYRKCKIKKEKTIKSIKQLKKIGWFSSAIIDSMLMEVEKND